MAIVSMILSGCSGPGSKMIPLRDFFRNPATLNYQVSPNAKYISFTKPFERRMNIFVKPIGAKGAKRVTSVKDRDIFSYFWKGNDHLIYLKDSGGDENYHLFVARRSGGDTKDLTPFAGVKAVIIDPLPDNDEELIIGLNKRNKEVFDAYKLNVITKKLKLLSENPGNILDWITDHNGAIRAAIATDGLNRSLLYRAADAGPFQNVMSIALQDTFDPLFFTFDNKALYCLSNINRDKIAAVVFDPESAKETGVIFEYPDGDVDGLTFSRKRKVLISAYYTGWKQERKVLDQEFSKIFDFLESRFPGLEISIVSMNRMEDKFIVSTSSDRLAGVYYLYEKGADKLILLADILPWLKKDKLAQVRPIKYESRDGLTIHGYLTLPKDKPAHGLPVVVHPHGGPWVRDTWRYNAQLQFLANRGYAVLQMNYRGSTGYGKKFYQASFKQWGRKMQDDITDGVNWLIKEGIADPERIAIYGGSYGGYAVLAGLAFTPDLYACGIDYVGVSNIFTLLESIPPYWKPELESLYEKIGHPQKDKALLEAVSPVYHADKIKSPLFVAQGARDPRVNINESNQIVEALKKHNIEVIYMVKDNEGHGFRSEENRFDFYEAMEKFLYRHLHPDK